MNSFGPYANVYTKTLTKPKLSIFDNNNTAVILHIFTNVVWSLRKFLKFGHRPKWSSSDLKVTIMMKFVEKIAFLVVLLLLSVSNTSGTSSYYDISYISFSSPILTPFPSSSKRISLAIVSDADDSPFQLVALSFPFNFFGRMIYNVFASPNGALHQSIAQPCQCNCFMEITQTTSCNYNTSYGGLIAGFLTDLDPSHSFFANVTYYKSVGYVSVIYSNIPMFDPKLSHQSFRINLYNDSRITIMYDNVFPNATKRGGTYPPLITGIRPPTTARHWNITMDQQQVGLTQWKTTYPGVYPMYNNVKSGMQFTACPFSKVWGARPKYINVTIVPTTTTASTTVKTIALTSLKVTLTPMLFSCGNLLDYVLYFDPSGVLAVNSTDYAVCNYRNDQTSVSGPIQSLVCDLTTLSTSSLSAGNKYGQLAWRVKGTFGWYTKLTITPIPLIFYTNTVASNNGFPLVTSCALNQVVPVGCSTPQATAQLCYGNYTCLKQPCITSTQSTLQQSNTLFQYPTCAAAKHDIRNKSCLTNLAYDNVGTCCRIDQQDCTGKCFGSSFIALWTPPNFPKILPTTRTWICCPSINTVDCAGYCIAPGQAGLERDACGKCGGTDKKGLGCSTGVTVTTGWGYNQLYYFIDYAVSSALWAVVPINITNTNTTSVMVNFSLAGSIYAGPDVSLNIPVATNVLISPHSFLTVPVNLSMQRVFNGLAQTWMVKTLIVTYWRPQLSDSVSFNYLVDTFPQSMNCTAISSAMACFRVPACILCPRMPQLRILEEEEEEDVDEDGEEEREEREDEKVQGDEREENEETEGNGEESLSSSSASSLAASPSLHSSTKLIHDDTKVDSINGDGNDRSGQDWMVGVDIVTSVIPSSLPSPSPIDEKLLPMNDEKNQDNGVEITIDHELTPHPFSMMTNISHQEWHGLNGVIPPSWGTRYHWWKEVKESDMKDKKSKSHSLHTSERGVDHPSYYDYPPLRREHPSDKFEDLSPDERILYTGLVPGSLGDTDDPTFVEGVCVSGFMSTDCPFPSVATRTIIPTWTIVLVISTIATIMGMTILLEN